MKILRIRDLYLKAIAVARYVAWDRAGASTRSHLGMADIGSRHFPRDHS
jgi:hypothetical protein